MTPGQVAFETFKECVGFYLPPWRFLESERQDAWGFAAAAVVADSRVAWEAAMAALTAENDLLRAELNSHVGKQGLKEMLRQMTGHAHDNAMLVAENDRLRAALESQLSELMETYPSYGMGGGSKSEERAQAQWEKEHGRQKAFLRTALAPPAPDAVAKGGAV